jgi:hypothetical protein
VCTQVSAKGPPGNNSWKTNETAATYKKKLEHMKNIQAIEYEMHASYQAEVFSLLAVLFGWQQRSHVQC